MLFLGLSGLALLACGSSQNSPLHEPERMSEMYGSDKLVITEMGSRTSYYHLTPFHSLGDILVPADMDSDGDIDLVLYNAPREVSPVIENRIPQKSRDNPSTTPEYELPK